MTLIVKEAVEKKSIAEARRQVLSFFTTLALRPDLVKRIERDNVLSAYIRNSRGQLVPTVDKTVSHYNLFETASNALSLHQLLGNTDNPFIDREMASLWQLFSGQDVGEGMDFYPLAEEFIALADRRVVSPLTRTEFRFRAGTPAFYAGMGERRMLVQDLVTVPGSRDPFSVTAAGFSSLVREYSPLVVVLTPVREKDWVMISELGAAFVDTLTILNDPIEARFQGNDPRRAYINESQRCFDICQNLSYTDWLRKLTDDNQKAVGPLFLRTNGRVSQWLDARHTVDIAVKFCDKEVLAETRKLEAVGNSGFKVEGVTNAAFVKALLVTLEGEFLSALDRTKKASEAASLAFVDSMVTTNTELVEPNLFRALTAFSNLTYGSWVTGLLSLWRRQFSDPTAAYIQGRR